MIYRLKGFALIWNLTIVIDILIVIAIDIAIDIFIVIAIAIAITIAIVIDIAIALMGKASFCFFSFKKTKDTVDSRRLLQKK